MAPKNKAEALFPVVEIKKDDRKVHVPVDGSFPISMTGVPGKDSTLATGADLRYSPPKIENDNS